LGIGGQVVLVRDVDTVDGDEIIRGHRIAELQHRHGIESTAILGGQVAYRFAGNCIHHGHALADDLPEYREAAVLVVQVRGVVGQVDEPLVGGAVGVIAQFG